jgi:hypothetical protein
MVEWLSNKIKAINKPEPNQERSHSFSHLKPVKAILGQSQAIVKPKPLRQLGSASILLGLSGFRLSIQAMATLLLTPNENPEPALP